MPEPLSEAPATPGAQAGAGRSAARTARAAPGHAVLVGVVGYRNLRDLSLGPLLLPRLEGTAWPDGIAVDVDDLSFGPVAVVQRLQDVDGRYGRLVLLAGVERGRPPGTVRRYRWTGPLPPADEIQARVAEAVTGVISLDNLLVIAAHFEALPPDVVVVEVEPQDTGWGEGLSQPVAAAADEALAAVRAAVERGAMPDG